MKTAYMTVLDEPNPSYPIGSSRRKKRITFQYRSAQAQRFSFIELKRLAQRKTRKDKQQRHVRMITEYNTLS